MAIQIVHGWRNLPEGARGAAVALGEFDGVHLGHQAVIGIAREAAAAHGVPLGVISFDPHPRRWFAPDCEPFELMTRSQQARAAEALGADYLYVLPFDAEMAAMSDETFARAVLAEGLGARHVAAGFDVTFGKDRSGDPALLKAYGDRLGFSVAIAPKLGDDGAKFSSTAIRLALKAGQPERAAAILGRPFAIEGVVQKGNQLGRTLGFPTANVPAGAYVRPKLGVYATRTRLPDGRVLPGVANFGENPATGRVEARLEVHLFDFAEDLYGQTLETELVAFLRPEENFDSIEALTAQIAEDAQAARLVLGGSASPRTSG